jgi:hypothetical protein
LRFSLDRQIRLEQRPIALTPRRITVLLSTFATC